MGLEGLREPEHQRSESIGTLLRDRYEVLRLLGEGGFASTYLALDHQTNRHCVIKELSWNKVEDWKFIELFEREARVLSNLDHPQIPRFIDFFTEPSDTGSRIFLIQEFIDGKNLRDLVKDGKHFTETEVIEIALQLTKILQYLHTLSPPIIHRDIKPSNILIDSQGEVHLVDFGAVRDKVLHSQKTEGGGFTVVGTYGFMPFEQFQGKAIPASDIYSLGASLVFLLSHKEPHEMDSDGLGLELGNHISVSKDFIAVLNKMLAHNYVERYQSADHLESDLKALLENRTPSILQSQKSVQTKWQAMVIASLVSVLAFGIWIATWQRTHTPPVQKVQPAVTAPFVVGTRDVVGSLHFDGKPIGLVSNVQPNFWFRNESTGKAVEAEVEYRNGTFRFIGLEPGSYGVQTTIDHAMHNPSMYPGDFYSWTPFTVREKNSAQLQIDLKRVIRITAPEDNGKAMPNWSIEPSEMTVLKDGEFLIRWESIGEDVYYDFEIDRMGAPYKFLGSAASGTTQSNEVKIKLPSNPEGQYYLMKIYARKDGHQIGLLMTHGAGGMGWDYRFRVK